MTIVEILVALVMISVLAGIGFVSMGSALDRAKQRSTMADMRVIARAVEAYSVDTDPRWTDVLPTEDHWGHSIQYYADATGSNYTLVSFGKDGLDGADHEIGAEFDYDADLVLFNGVFTAAPE
jgi:type II secretory pathway pseudopilin PulG